MNNYDKIPFKNMDIDFFGGKKKKIRNMRQEGQKVARRKKLEICVKKDSMLN
jgi:hypothetical protein